MHCIKRARVGQLLAFGGYSDGNFGIGSELQRMRHYVNLGGDQQMQLN